MKSFIHSIKKKYSASYVINFEDIEEIYNNKYNDAIQSLEKEEFLNSENDHYQPQMPLQRTLSVPITKVEKTQLQARIFQPLLELLSSSSSTSKKNIENDITFDYVKFNGEINISKEYFPREIRVSNYGLVIVDINNIKAKPLTVKFKDILEFYLDPDWQHWSIHLNNGTSLIFKLKYPCWPVHIFCDSLYSNYNKNRFQNINNK